MQYTRMHTGLTRSLLEGYDRYDFTAPTPVLFSCESSVGSYHPSQVSSNNSCGAFIALTDYSAPSFGEYLPGIGGFSFLFFLFVISSIYVVIRRFGSIVHVWNHRVFLVSYVLIFISIVLETYSPFANYSEIIRIAKMFIGAIIIATLCRDIKALKLFIFGCILAGVVASFYLFLSVYRPLQGVKATDFNEASKVRAEVFSDESMQVNR